ncbi:DUF6214 family protein [Streptomyces sp. CWNU-1]|uniref:DUF6214 family protein n=2 Tax=Streptomyces albipurpureus TaxID=2897419 RepID=A0ABT0UUU8_9ACTN|nr:DUF6214 family protein [Streptomyces sp. CWNU-1]
MLPYPPVWEVQGHGVVTLAADPGQGMAQGAPSPWFNVRLTFADGARLDVDAVLEEGQLVIEDLRADPPLPLRSFTILADRIEHPLADACRAVSGRLSPVAPSVGAATHQPHAGTRSEHSDEERDGVWAQEGRSSDARPVPPGHRRARPASPRGRAVRQIAAAAYLAAQQAGLDPVLAVMNATGRSRRKSLRLIAGARDEGLLTPRHNRR